MCGCLCAGYSLYLLCALPALGGVILCVFGVCICSYHIICLHDCFVHVHVCTLNLCSFPFMYPPRCLGTPPIRACLDTDTLQACLSVLRGPWMQGNMTALMWAAQMGHRDTALELIRRNATIDVTTKVMPW